MYLEVKVEVESTAVAPEEAAVEESSTIASVDTASVDVTAVDGSSIEIATGSLKAIGVAVAIALLKALGTVAHAGHAVKHLSLIHI